MLWKIRTKYLNLKWDILWPIIEALGLEEWADRRWHQKFLGMVRRNYPEDNWLA